MKWGHLSDYFDAVVFKLLSAVEAEPNTSNQHEFNGSRPFRNLFGDDDRRSIQAQFMYLKPNT